MFWVCYWQEAFADISQAMHQDRSQKTHTQELLIWIMQLQSNFNNLDIHQSTVRQLSKKVENLVLWLLCGCRTAPYRAMVL